MLKPSLSVTVYHSVIMGTEQKSSAELLNTQHLGLSTQD